MESLTLFRASPWIAVTMLLAVACGSDEPTESAPGGTAGTGAAAGSGGTGGASSTGGASGTGGTAGVAGSGGAAGMAGSGASAGVGGSGGSAGVSGNAGSAGQGGTAGVAGSAGTGGTAGSSGTGGAAGSAGTGGAGGTGPTQVRIAAANLSSGNMQSYDPGHGIRILQGLKPDLVLIQEFNYGDNSSADLQSFVSTTFGAGFSYAREGGQIPNGVISRYPILESGEWDDPEVFNRDFVWARIDIPVDEDLWAVSVHLLTTKQGDRTKEANALVGYLDAQIPDGALVVLGGDFNTATRGEGCVSTLSAWFDTEAPYPVDQDDNSNTNAYRNSPYDWVVATPPLDGMQAPVQIGSQSFPDGLVFDSRVYTPLSDVPPVQEGDSDAAQMQHMAVVRDFVIP